MVKNHSFPIILQEENRENTGFAESQVVSFINKIDRVALKIGQEIIIGLRKILRTLLLLAYLFTKTQRK